MLLYLVPMKMRAQDFQFVVSGDSLTSNVPMNEISPKAFRHFEQQFGVVAVTSWHKYLKGYMVTFPAADSSVYYVYMTRRGTPYRTVIVFTISGVPREVRAAMAAYDHGGSILFAGELLQGEKPLYEVGLEDASTVRIVDMRDGEIQTVCEYKRGADAVAAGINQ